jgi:hypothetical protein
VCLFLCPPPAEGGLITGTSQGTVTGFERYGAHGKLYGSRGLTQAEEGMRRGMQGESTEVLSPCVLRNID